MYDEQNKDRDSVQRKSGTMGAGACLLSLLGLFLLAAAAMIALIAFREASLTAGKITAARILLLIAAVSALAAIIVSLIAFFRKRQKKALAAVSTVLALLIFAVSFGATYAYEYMIGGLENDNALSDVSDQELQIRQPDSDGRINRETELLQETLSPEEIMDSIDIEQVEWEYLTDEDIPQEALDKMKKPEAVNHSFLLEGSEQISNFLLLGLDAKGSSDTMIVFSLDRVHHKIKMTSIARDSYVMIPAWGSYAKLNYAYNWGGPEWTIAAINYNFSLNITDYIAVDMDQLTQIIDLVGGVDLELSDAEASYLGVPSGKNHFDGTQTLSYSRIRYLDSEEARTGRQRKVLTSILHSVMNMDLSDYPTFIRSCLSMCRTSFDSGELLSLAAEAAAGGYSIEQYALIGMMDYWGGNLGDEQYFYVVYDLNRASDALYRIIYEDLYVSGYMDPGTEEQP